MTSLDNIHSQKTFILFYSLLKMREKSNYSVFDYYFENIGSERVLESINILGTAIWLGGDWVGTVPKNIRVVKESLIDFGRNNDTELAKSALVVLRHLCAQDDDILTEDVLLRCLELFDCSHTTICIAYDFPVTKGTILHLKGVFLTTAQIGKLEELMDKEVSTNNLLGYFWFGAFYGAWDLVTVINKAKEFQSADYISDSELETLCIRMKSYLTVLFEENAIDSVNEDFVQEYFDELEMLEQQRKKKLEVFDW